MGCDEDGEPLMVTAAMFEMCIPVKHRGHVVREWMSSIPCRRWRSAEASNSKS